jgi:hypothetical protein
MSARTKRTSGHELITFSARLKVLKSAAAASSRSGTSADLLLSLCIRQTVTSPTVRNTSDIMVQSTYKYGIKLPNWLLRNLILPEIMNVLLICNRCLHSGTLHVQPRLQHWCHLTSPLALPLPLRILANSAHIFRSSCCRHTAHSSPDTLLNARCPACRSKSFRWTKCCAQCRRWLQ